MDLTKTTLQIFSKLEHDWLHHSLSPKTRILSIDSSSGGTTTTTVSAALIHLENQIISQSGDPTATIADFFDLIAGSGTGAVYAALLSSRPSLSAASAAQFVAGLSPPRRRQWWFSGKKTEKALKEAFKGRDGTRGEDGKMMTLRDTCKPILVPCYDLASQAPFVFSRADASGSDSFDFDLWKVCRAAMSDSDGVGKPFGVASVDGKTSCLAVGGGLAMSSPAAAAVMHVLHNKRDFPSVNGVEDILVLSLGNNTNLSHCKSLKFRRNGACSTSSLVRIALDGVSDTVDQMLANAFSWNRSDYVRIQANCDVTGVMKTDMECVLSERGVETLPFGGKRLMAENNTQIIENFVRRLVASGKTSLPPSPCKETAVSPLANGR